MSLRKYTIQFDIIYHFAILRGRRNAQNLNYGDINIFKLKVQCELPGRLYLNFVVLKLNCSAGA